VGPWLVVADGDRVDAGTLRCGAVAPIEGRIVARDGTATYGVVSIDSTDAFDAETWALLTRCGLARIDVPYACAGVGGFSITSLPAGRYVLHAEDDGAPQTVIAPANDVRLAAPPAPTIDVAFRLAERDGTFATCRTAEVRSLADGGIVRAQWCRFSYGQSDELRAWPDDDAGVRVLMTTADGRSVSCDVAPLTRGAIVLDLPPRPRTRSIRGIATFGGRPITWRSSSEPTDPFVHVSARRVEDGAERGHCGTAADGSFEIDGLEDGAYLLWASPTDGARDAPSIATTCVVADAGRGDVVVAMPAARRRPLRLVLPDGIESIDDAESTIDGPADEVDVASSEWNDGGLTAATGLRTGVVYRLWIRVRCGATWTGPATAAFVAGDDPIELRLPLGLAIAGVVTRGDGSPVVGACVHGNSSDDRCADACSTITGAFALTGLAPGKWTIVATAPGLSTADEGVAADAGARDVRIVVRPSR